MSIKENLISRSSPAEINQDLRRELDSALALIKDYESVIADLKLENSSNYKKFTHELANPLQILAMTIESLQTRLPTEFQETVLRMKRSTDNMTEIIHTIRRLRASTTNSSGNINIV